jgi:alkylation response protein AidB-like acyl-CoA dehydrogenase
LVGAKAARINSGSLDVGALRTYENRRDLAVAGEMLAVGVASLEATLDYVRVREQFGQPVGRFQAIKHRLAHAWMRVDAAHQSLYSALDAVEDETFGASLAAAACAMADESTRLAVSEGIQFHGGMGFTWEIDAHLYYRRWFMDAALLAGGDQHLDRLATHLGV